MGCSALLQGIFLTQASNPALSCLLLVGGFFTTSVTWDALRFCRLFPHSLAVKESTCNAGDPGSIPASGRSAREGIGYPHQYSWASLVTQLVKNPPAIWETWVQSLGCDLGMIPRRRERLPIPESGLENSMDGIVHWVKKCQT